MFAIHKPREYGIGKVEEGFAIKSAYYAEQCYGHVNKGVTLSAG